MVRRRNYVRGDGAGGGDGDSATAGAGYRWNRHGRSVQATAFAEGCAERRRRTLQYFRIHGGKSNRRDVWRRERTSRNGRQAEADRSGFLRKERNGTDYQLRSTQPAWKRQAVQRQLLVCRLCSAT